MALSVAALSAQVPTQPITPNDLRYIEHVLYSVGDPNQKIADLERREHAYAQLLRLSVADVAALHGAGLQFRTSLASLRSQAAAADSAPGPSAIASVNAAYDALVSDLGSQLMGAFSSATANRIRAQAANLAPITARLPQ